MVPLAPHQTRPILQTSAPISAYPPLNVGDTWYYQYSSIGGASKEQIIRSDNCGGSPCVVDQETNSAWNDTTWQLPNWTITREYYVDHTVSLNASTIYTPGIHLYDFPLQVGEEWWSNGTAAGWYKQSTYNYTQHDTFQLLRKVLNQTIVNVPAGTFNTFLVADYVNGTQLRQYRWFSIDAKTSVKVDFYYPGSAFLSDSYVMTSYSLAPPPKPAITITNLSPNPVMPDQQVRLDFTVVETAGMVTATWVDWGDGSTPDVIFNMTSASMCPISCAISPGDLVLVRSEEPSTITDGSIILFRPFVQHPEFLVLHRVINVIPPSESGYNQYAFVTKGDANGAPDSWPDFPNGIPASSVLGVYQSTFSTTNVPGARYDTHSYEDMDTSSSRTYEVHVNATDETGATSQTSVTQVVKDPPPYATIFQTTPIQATIGTAFTLTVDAYDPDGSLASLTIQWGDGKSTIDNTPNISTSKTHTYNATGTYMIKIIVTDSSESTSQAGSTTVTVTAPPSPSAPQPTILGLPRLVFYAIIGAGIAVALIISALALRTRKKPETL